MAKKMIAYEEAMTEVEAILGRIQREEVSMDNLAKEVRRATELIAQCRQRLRKVEKEVDEIVKEV